jgi:phosphatidylserine decarboxylase
MWSVVLGALQRLPQGALSRLFGALADIPVPRVLRPLILGGFVRLVGIRMDEAEKPVTAYPSVNGLFVRRLAPGARSWPGRGDVLASPVDGVVGEVGRIRHGTLVQAKGLSYGVEELLGSGAAAAPFMDGTFLTIYLSPRHYHRIHTPLPGWITGARHLPGALLPVNRPAVERIPRLFARNERLSVAMDTDLGRVEVVAVGAYNVGRISAAFDAEWSGRAGTSITNRAHPPTPSRTYDPPVPMAEGDEIMAFHLGSTVILLTEERLELASGVAPGAEVQVGQLLAARG